MRILVTDGNLRATLAAVRALGMSGAEVVVGSTTSSSLAGSSRHCDRQVQYPDPITDPCGFKSFLVAQARARSFDVLLPVSDITTQLTAQVREQFPSSISVLSAKCEQLGKVSDKRQTILCAREVAVPVPETYMVGEEESIDEVAARISYPAVLKPRFSWLHRDGKWANGGVEFAVDAAELKEKYARIHATNPFPLVQRRLEGEGKGVFLLVWDGELKAAFAHRRLREKPPWGGVSTYCESMPIDPDLVQSSLSLLRHIGWNGVAMVEFKVDKLDGVPKLMEINGRLWGSLQLAIDAGVNFPFLFYRLAMGEDVPPQFTYQVGVRSRWFWGDFDQLVIRLKNRGVTAADGRSRLGAIGDFLRLFEAKTRYDVFRLADPAPGWFETRAYLRENFGSRLRGVNRAR